MSVYRKVAMPDDAAPESHPLLRIADRGRGILKVAFLDFDGVLNMYGVSSAKAASMPMKSVGTVEWCAANLDPVMARRVQRICDETGAVIVLSTSWRNVHSVRVLTSALQSVGITAPVIGVTPCLVGDGVPFVPRDHEIRAWNEATGVTEFVVLDDIDMVLPGIAERSVCVNGATGVTNRDVERAIEILRGGAA